MDRFLSKLRGMDTVLLVRHLAISAGTTLVLIWRTPIQGGNQVLWIFCSAILLNFILAVLSDRPRLSNWLRPFSPAVGVASWGLLASQTGGVHSPFVAGFSLEILLSILAFPGKGTRLITLGSVLSLWTQQAWSGFGGTFRLLGLQTGFLLAIGAVALVLADRWEKARAESSLRQGELQSRLEQLQREMDTLDLLHGTGENTARLAHCVKNSIHAMRGFTTLIQHAPAASEEGAPAVDGLRSSLQRLEEVVRIVLGKTRSSAVGDRILDGSQPEAAIHEVIREVALSFPKVRWSIQLQEPLPVLRLPGAVVHEVLLSLVRNAAEAMQGIGQVRLEARLAEGELEIAVADQGSGIGEQELSRLFKPGYSTKSEGSGLGLFLARRVMESYGGSLRVTPRPEGGALFSMGIPLANA